MSVYLKNARYLDYKSLDIVDGNMFIKEGINGEVSFIPSIPEKVNSDDIVIDCSGKIVMRSFVNGHHHVYSALSRGMNPPKVSPTNFYEILKYVWWTLDKCLNPEMIRLSALTTAMACAKNGVTFVIDHHASPFAIENSLEIIADAFDEVGVSHLLCYEITDRDGLDKADAGLDETKNYLAKYQGLVGLHAAFTVCEDTLAKSVALAKEMNSGIHIHVAEDLYDQEFSVKTYGTRIINRLNKAGVLDFSKTILGHCLHLEDEERKIIAGSPCWVVQNSESNLNNNVGYFNSKGLDVNHVMLGTDGMHSDMLRSAKSAFYVGQRFDQPDGGMSYPAIYNRFRNAHNYISENGFKGDGANNLVIMDYDTPTPLTSSNFYGHFLFGLESRQILHVISDGKLIVKDRVVTTVDEVEILSKSREIAPKLWSLMSA